MPNSSRKSIKFFFENDTFESVILESVKIERGKVDRLRHNLISGQRCLLVLDPKEKIAFCRNPKVASSTWLTRFHSLYKTITPKEEIQNMTPAKYHEDAHK